MPEATVVLEQPSQPLWHVLGTGAQPTLRAAGLPLPEQDMAARFHGDGFVLRVGAREYLVGASRAPAPVSDPRAWVFARHDHLLALHGPGWRSLMPWVCHFDFRNLKAGHWLQVAVAGVDVWVLPREAERLLIGCDPSYGAYLHGLFQQLIREHAGSLSTD